MNYYEKHIGDYIRDTVSLSMLEDGAYNRLIDQCYQTERPLPADKKEVYRLARASSASERKAVDYVLQRYFVLTEDGYVQKRIQAEIEKFQAKTEDKQGRKENERERQRRHRQRRKELFAALREHGEVPHYDTSTDDLVALLSRVTQRDGNAPVTRTATATQAPSTRHQTPEEIEAAAVEHGLDAAAAPLSGSDPILARAIELTTLLLQRGAALQASDPRVRQWASDGVTDAQALSALEIAEQRRADQASPQPINAGLLNAILSDLTTGSRPSGKRARASAPPWWSSNERMIAKGKQLGLDPRPGEDWASFRARIDAKLLESTEEA